MIKLFACLFPAVVKPAGFGGVESYENIVFSAAPKAILRSIFQLLFHPDSNSRKASIIHVTQLLLNPAGGFSAACGEFSEAFKTIVLPGLRRINRREAL
jgi:hypothetical protein